jgi:hypothetical protein
VGKSTSAKATVGKSTFAKATVGKVMNLKNEGP